MLQAFTGVYGSDRETVARSNVTYSTTTIAAAATIGVYTATPVQFIASTAFDVTQLRIWNVAANANSGLRGDTAIEIMIGAGGSEVPIATFLFGGRPAYSSYTIPIYIPAGTRISGRVAAGVASRSLTWNLEVKGVLDDDMGALPSRWVPYGTTISSGVGAYGTEIVAGSTNAWSSWTAITTSTTYAHSLWLPMVAVGTQTTITAVNYRTQFAVATTAQAATMVTNATGAFEGPWFTGNTTESFGQFATATNPVHIGLNDIIHAERPEGSAVSGRAMCSGTSTSQTTSFAILAAVK
jgi:hypothetical protein